MFISIASIKFGFESSFIASKRELASAQIYALALTRINSSNVILIHLDFDVTKEKGGDE